MNTSNESSEQFQMQLFEIERTLRTAGKRAESDKPIKFFDWTVREMPRSWRLETCSINNGFRSAQKFYAVHGALLRQLHGLTRGHFSLAELPTALLKGPASFSGVYEDRDMSDDLAGRTASEKRIFNLGLRDSVQLFLAGIEPWPEFPCPRNDGRDFDHWSFDLWEKDQKVLKAAFTDLISPHRIQSRRLDGSSSGAF